MRAITVYQPWASLLAAGVKSYETRSWRPIAARDPIAIHAGGEIAYVNTNGRKHILGEPGVLRALTDAGLWNPRESHGGLPIGAVVAVALDGCHPYHIEPSSRAGQEPRIDPSDLPELEVTLGDWSMGRYAWKMLNVIALPEPVPCKGAQSLWRLPLDVWREVRRQIDEEIPLAELTRNSTR